jgi:hypothetical protein
VPRQREVLSEQEGGTVSPLSADDQLATALDEIRERWSKVAYVGLNPEVVPEPGHQPSWLADVSRLLAALEAADAALKRHMQWFGSMGERLCGGCLRPVPCPDTNVIAAALAKGGGGTDG